MGFFDNISATFITFVQKMWGTAGLGGRRDGGAREHGQKQDSLVWCSLLEVPV